MHVAVVGHIVIDHIVSNLIDTVTLGGPPSYAGLTARALGADVSLLTAYGPDLPEEYLLWLIRNQLKIPRGSLSKTYPTTRFKIVQTRESREIYLKSRCEDVKPPRGDLRGGSAVISPVAGEVDDQIFKAIRENFETVYLDPQGLLRRFQPDGRCTLGEMDIELLRYVDVIKVDSEEALKIAGSRDPLQALKYLTGLGPKVAVYTLGSKGALIRCGGDVFKVPALGHVKVVDTTGAGDIFAGAFTAAYLQGGESVWSCCVAVAASSIGLDRVGLSKIPDPESIFDVARDISGRVEKVDAT